MIGGGYRLNMTRGVFGSSLSDEQSLQLHGEEPGWYLSSCAGSDKIAALTAFKDEDWPVDNLLLPAAKRVVVVFNWS